VQGGEEVAAGVVEGSSRLKCQMAISIECWTATLAF
jgi:hypothetical protein